MSSLSQFIRQNDERIVAEWETFASSIPLEAEMSIRALRDHAQAMLQVIAEDLETPQTSREQADKSKGFVLDERLAWRSAAGEHGYGRATSGFTVGQMVAEFRALRATVVRLWMQEERHFGSAELDDLIRFNEAIDQAIAESLRRYSRQNDETRERFLAILGHDLRNPLGAIAMASAFLLETATLDSEQTKLMHAIAGSERRMSRLVDDLLDLALSRLGDGIPIVRNTMNAADVVNQVVAETRAAYPGVQIDARFDGDLEGRWDAARLAQALTNLLRNAVEHGDATAPIRVAARRDEREVLISVHNEGPAIPPNKMAGLFEAMKGGQPRGRDRRHLGLGLFIVDKIVEGHSGTVDVESTAERGTTFTIRLPNSEE